MTFVSECISLFTLNRGKAGAVGVELAGGGELVPWYLRGVNVQR